MTNNSLDQKNTENLNADSGESENSCTSNFPNDNGRQALARRNRITAFEADNGNFPEDHDFNCDDSPAKSFTKTLRRAGNSNDDKGLAAIAAFDRLKNALETGTFEAFEKLAAADGGDSQPALGNPTGNGLNLTNPLAGFTLDTQGPDTHVFEIKTAPKFSSKETAAEMAELYQMALLRDRWWGGVFERSPKYIETLNYLNNNFTYFRTFNKGSKLERHQLFNAAIPGKPEAFRGLKDGPYISQFLLRGTSEFDETGIEIVTPLAGVVALGTLRLSQKQRSVLKGIVSNFLFKLDMWRDAQAGVNFSGKDRFERNTLRFIRNFRDLGNYVHFDKIYQEYFVAACILLTQIPRTGARKLRDEKGGDIFNEGMMSGMIAPDMLNFDMSPEVLNPGNPYQNSAAQNGFATFGATHILTGLAEVATRAHRHAFFQKWLVHRRIRPEEFSGRVHFDVKAYKENTSSKLPFDIDEELLVTSNSEGLLDKIFNLNGNNSYLLPQVFPEGCPTHPAYPAAHATLAGASVTMLKAFFNEDFSMTKTEERPELPPIAVTDSNGVVLFDPTQYSGYEAYKGIVLSVGGELNKLASNIAFGRSWAGVHWRTDNTIGLLLGEEVAIGLLKEQSLGFRENPNAFFQFTKFDETLVVIKEGKCFKAVKNNDGGVTLDVECSITEYLTAKE